MHTNHNKNSLIKILIICVLIITVSVVAVRVLLQLQTLQPFKKYLTEFKVGQISDVDVSVNFTTDIIDKNATTQLKEENKKKILPYFSYSVSTSLQIISSFDMFRTFVENKNYPHAYNQVGKNISIQNISMYSNLVLDISSEIISKACNIGFYNSDEISMVLAQGYNQINTSSSFLSDNSGEVIVDIDDIILTDKTFESFISDSIKAYSDILDNIQIYQIHEITRNFIKQNVFYDSLITAERKSYASDITTPVVLHFNRGDKIINKDQIITSDMLDLLNLLSIQKVVSLNDTLSTAILCILGFSLLFYEFLIFGSKENYNIKHFTYYFVILTVGISLSCFLSYFSLRLINYNYISYDLSILPACFMPILITMMLNKKSFGIITSVVTSVSLTLISNTDIVGFFYLLITGISSVFLVTVFNKRTAMIIQWALTTVFIILETILFMFISAVSFSSLFYVTLSVFLNISASMLLISVLMPLLEEILNLPTVFRLYELASTDNKLLIRLKTVAPGTYTHSVSVSELAYQAAKEISANALLAKVGALYHDVGKMEHPDYYTENQTGENKHDILNPALSASIIKNHVKSGAEMGRVARLPEEVIDIIANHHGTSIIRYFYHEAKNEIQKDGNANNETVSEEDYRYNAEIPNTKECAIVSLADSVEATARSISEPNLIKYQKMISKTIMNMFEAGQLDNSNLTINDLAIISKSFLSTLSAQNHSRIVYPDEEKNVK